jgi:hypothetical protein
MLGSSLPSKVKENIIFSIFRCDYNGQVIKNLYNTLQNTIPSCPFNIGDTIRCSGKTYKYFADPSEEGKYNEEYVEIGKAKLLEYNPFSSEPYLVEYEKMNSSGNYFTISSRYNDEYIHPIVEGLADNDDAEDVQ